MYVYVWWSIRVYVSVYLVRTAGRKDTTRARTGQNGMNVIHGDTAKEMYFKGTINTERPLSWDVLGILWPGYNSNLVVLVVVVVMESWEVGGGRWRL